MLKLSVVQLPIYEHFMKYVLLLFLLSFSLRAETIILRADEWCPYNCAPNSDQEGYILEIIRDEFSKEGIKIEYQVWPWAKSIKAAQMNFVAGVIGALKEEVPDFIYPEVEQGKSISCFYALKESGISYQSIQDLNGKLIGAIGQYSYGEKIDSYFKKNLNKVQFLSNVSSAYLNVRKLLNKKIDLIVEDRNVMGRLLNKMKLSDEIINVGCEGSGELVYIAFSPKNSMSNKYAQITTRAFKSARESGRLEAVLKKYGLSDWK